MYGYTITTVSLIQLAADKSTAWLDRVATPLALLHLTMHWPRNGRERKMPARDDCERDDRETARQIASLDRLIEERRRAGTVSAPALGWQTCRPCRQG